MNTLGKVLLMSLPMAAVEIYLMKKFSSDTISPDNMTVDERNFLFALQGMDWKKKMENEQMKRKFKIIKDYDAGKYDEIVFLNFEKK